MSEVRIFDRDRDTDRDREANIPMKGAQKLKQMSPSMHKSNSLDNIDKYLNIPAPKNAYSIPPMRKSKSQTRRDLASTP